MKKIIMIFTLMLLVTGCSKSYQCIKTDETGLITTETLNLKFNNDKVTKVKQNINIKFNELYINTIDDTYDMLYEQYRKYNKKDGYKATAIKENDTIDLNLNINLKKTTNKSIDLFDIALSENELIKDLESKGYICE